jgi:acyl-CoA synthetase (AMP-forming)/AMP-acid ligase II
MFNGTVSQPSEAPGEPCFLFPFPLCHIAGFAVLGQHLGGNPVALMTAYSPEEWLRMVDELKVTTTALAPTMINMLLNHPEIDRYDVSSLTSLGYGASSIPAEVLNRALDRFGPIFTQGFGMTELSGNVIFMSKADHLRAAREAPHLLRAAGRVGALAEVRIVDETGRDCPVGEPGEIIVRGDQVLAGYWNRPDAMREAFRDGWFHTGDVARMDEEGFVYLLDRMKDMVITGGENVYTSEVEAALYKHEKVHECAVVGVPDDTYGEALLVAVVPVPGETLDEAELIAHCRKHIGGYKIPRRYVFLDELPKSAMNKILKNELRATYGGEAAKEKAKAS